MQNSSSEFDLTATLNSDVESLTEYLLPDDIPIDPEATLDQLTGRFRSLRDGLPELVKNSKDQYSRLGVTDADDRQIVVVLSTDARALAVIDFAGAPAENFQGWTTWSDPSAGKVDLAADIEAGHGNGGKAFMVRGATQRSFLESTFNGRRTRKGFVNDRPGQRYKPGFGVVNGVKIDDVEEVAPADRLEEILRSLGTTITDLPPSAQAAFEARQAYTVAFLDQVVEWVDRKRKKLKTTAAAAVVDIIGSHGQTAMTIETCRVWVVADGIIVGRGPVKPVAVEPYPGFEEPRIFAIPDVLPDPETGESVDVRDGREGSAYLKLQTSARQLQMSQETRAKNVVRVWNNRNNVATWPLQALHGVSAASFIFGELRCPSLTGDHLSGAERLHLSDTPLVRALEHWARGRVEELANDLHQAMAEKTNPKDRERARSALSSIRDLMRRFLDADAAGGTAEGSEMGGASGSGSTGQRGERDRDSYGERVDEILLESGRGDIALICGTRVPLMYRCLEIDGDGISRPVRHPRVELVCTPDDQFTLDADGLISAAYPGVGRIWLETADGSISSNQVEVWVGMANDVAFDTPSASLMQGERRQLRFTFETDDGPLDDALIDAEVLEPEMGRIGRHGRFTAGLQEGDLTIRVRYGAATHEFRDCVVNIGTERVPPPEGTGEHGSDVPEILFCGDEAPGMAEYPPEQRTVPGGPELPTIIEDPLFPNVVWINPSSKEAVRVRRSGGGSSGVGKVTSRTFMHFVALKCFDILKRLHVRQQIAGGSVTEYQYMQYAAEAEMECAEFIDAAWDLGDKMVTREGLADA
jgi:hypothetical protein